MPTFLKLTLTLIISILSTHLHANESFGDILNDEFSAEEQGEAKRLLLAEAMLFKLQKTAKVQAGLMEGHLSPYQKAKLQDGWAVVSTFEILVRVMSNEAIDDLKELLEHAQVNPKGYGTEASDLEIFALRLALIIRVANEFNELTPQMVAYAGETLARILLADATAISPAAKHQVLLALAAVAWEGDIAQLPKDFFHLQSDPQSMSLVLTAEHQEKLGKDLCAQLEAIYFATMEARALEKFFDSDNDRGFFFHQGEVFVKLMAQVEQVTGKKYDNLEIKQLIFGEFVPGADLQEVYQTAKERLPSPDDFGGDKVQALRMNNQIIRFMQNRYLTIARERRGH